MVLSLLLVAVLCFAVFLVAVPLFEGVVSVFLLTPLLALLVSRIATLCGIDSASAAVQPWIFALSMILIVMSAYLLFGRRRDKLQLHDVVPFAVSGVVFLVAFWACSVLWPDFVPLGERLRDYSLIVSAVHSPFVARESWMEGTPLNYYVYWYRCGAMLHALLGLQIWHVYHAMVALAVALYSGVCYQIVRVVLGSGVFTGVLAALALPFGANVAGMLLVSRTEDGGWVRDNGWWGASRVVQGAITEFPAWSFLLGDAHPHYLNLVAVPLLFLLLYRALHLPGSPAAVVARCSLLIVAGVLFLMGSNAWEVPMWFGLAAITCGLVVLQRCDGMKCPCWKELDTSNAGVVARAAGVGVITIAAAVVALRTYNPEKLGALVVLAVVVVAFAYWFFPWAAVVAMARTSRTRATNRHIWPVAIAWIVLLVALRLNSSHIVPEAGFVSYVRDPIAVTTTVELLGHWGVHVVLLGMTLLFLSPPSLANVLVAIVTVGAVGYCKAGAALFVLLVGFLHRVVTDTVGRADQSGRGVFSGALVISGIGLLLVPEIVFLNDPYGGAHERMNTIFKVYTTAWSLLGLGVVGMLIQALRSREALPGIYRPLCYCVGAVVSLLFVVGTVRFYADIVPKRIMARSEESGAEGLGRVNEEHPGSAVIIRTLRGLPRGRVLEGQGNPYSYTTFISTLAGQPSYLGWENHLNLLSKVHGEVGRRSDVTKQVYGAGSCEERVEIARRESIRYVVFGGIERSKYPSLLEGDFECFKKLARAGEYLLFEVPS